MPADKPQPPRGLAREIGKREPFASPHQELFLNLMRTAGVLAAPFERLFKAHGLSGATYNALRILRGAGEEGCSCTRIGEHLVAAVPDVTRLIDRLERAGLASRAKGADDRRVVTVRMTPEGLAILKKLDGPLLALHKSQLGHLSKRDTDSLIGLLEKARAGQPDRSGCSGEME